MSKEPTIPDLIPWDFAPKVVLTPERILQHQANLIGQKSGQRLRGELERSESEKTLTLGLVVSAPLINYAVRLFSCWHARDMPYPVRFPDSNIARDEKQFRDTVVKILSSDSTRSVFQSLIARVGDVENSDEVASAEEIANSEYD